jgi:hypothetical protein
VELVTNNQLEFKVDTSAKTGSSTAWTRIANPINAGTVLAAMII